MFMRKLLSHIAITTILISGSLLLAEGMVSCSGCGGNAGGEEQQAYQTNAPAFNTDSAYQYLKEQCSFGPRTMNSAAHDSCADYLVKQFERFGAKVTLQHALRPMYDGTQVRIRNIIASYNEAEHSRLMLCAHWDSRPWADNDTDASRHKTPIDGANDGASGVAVLLEVARQIQLKAPELGIDLICFDAEDCGTPQWVEDGEDHESTWCLGSQFWASAPHVPNYHARFAILLDMVGGGTTEFCKEYFSVRSAPAVVDKVWARAQAAGFGEYFNNDMGSPITDDHLQVMKLGIPCIDIIGSDRERSGFCRTWHTMADNVQNIDRSTLNAVGQTILEVIYNEE